MCISLKQIYKSHLGEIAGSPDLETAGRAENNEKFAEPLMGPANLPESIKAAARYVQRAAYTPFPISYASRKMGWSFTSPASITSAA